MKPIKLILKNVGPYRDEKIDFTSLDNMFLIAGNTGLKWIYAVAECSRFRYQQSAWYTDQDNKGLRFW